MLPNIADADVIGAFLSGTTCESLVHKLGHKGPQTTKELIDIATSHASGEEVVRVIFDRLKVKAKRDENAREGASNRPNKKKNKQRREGYASPSSWVSDGLTSGATPSWSSTKS